MKRNLVNIMAGIAALSTLALSAEPLGVALAFTTTNKCQGQSPEIRLTQVPSGTTAYKVQMTDEQVPTFRHWNETLPATGPVIPAGASKSYYGPCPPSGKHTYRVTVTALDSAGKVLAQGTYRAEANSQ